MIEEPATRAPAAPQAPCGPGHAPDTRPDRAEPPQGPTTARFEGHDNRECGEHRTTGSRAWCFDDSEWCYPDIPCRGCELPALRRRAEQAERDRDKALDQITDERRGRLAAEAAVRRARQVLAGMHDGVLVRRLLAALTIDQPKETR